MSLSNIILRFAARQRNTQLRVLVTLATTPLSDHVEIARELNLTTSQVSHALGILRRKGLVQRIRRSGNGPNRAGGLWRIIP